MTKQNMFVNLPTELIDHIGRIAISMQTGWEPDTRDSWQWDVDGDHAVITNKN
jgi:hypothetical protein